MDEELRAELGIVADVDGVDHTAGAPSEGDEG